MDRLRLTLSVGLVCLVMASLNGCGGGSTSSSNNGGNGGGGGGGNPAPNAQGTVALPNGSQGVAIVHIEDSSGKLLTTPLVSNVAAAGTVSIIAEPPDFSQGVVASGQSLQTLNTATTSPQMTDNVSVSGDGNPLSAAVITGSTFSVVQMSQQTSFATTCFTGGLHMTQGGGPTAGPAGTLAYATSADGTMMSGWDTSGNVQFFLVTASQNPHAVSFNNFGSYNLAAPSMGGRGAMAFDPTNAANLLAGAPNGALAAFTSLATGNTQSNVIMLSGTPAVASIAYAPTAKYAIVATNAGLFTVNVSSSGTPNVVLGPVNPSYQGSDGKSYQLSGAQSIAITQDGKYLVALTNQPSATNGTLVAMPVDASGNVGSVGMTQGGFLATQNMDVLFAH
jgi:hypothetical protein